MLRHTRLAAISFAAIAVSFWLAVSMGGSSAATPAFGSASATNVHTPLPAITIAVDTDTSGNWATQVGDIQSCSRISSFSDQLTIDVVIVPPGAPVFTGEGHSAGAGIVGFGFDLAFDSNVVSLIGVDNEFLVSSPPGSVRIESIQMPSYNNPDVVRVDYANIGDNLAAGAGVLSRITIQPELSGVSDLTLRNVVVYDAEYHRYPIADVINASVSVIRRCPAPPSPTPLPPPGDKSTSFIVNTTADTVDAAPGDGTCKDAGGQCSLRAAVQEANALATPVIINLPPGVYVLSLAGANEDLAATGDLDITGDVTVRGEHAKSTTIDGDGGDRIFDVKSGASLLASGITLRNGIGSAVGFPDGTAILSAGRLELADSIVTANQAGSGNHSIAAAGETTLTKVSIRANLGGGVSNGSSGDMEIASSHVSDNGSGGVANFGDLRIIATTIEGNAGSGIADFGNFGPGFLLIKDSTVRNNTGAYQGGGVFVRSGTAGITDSQITHNEATTFGGGIAGDTGAVTVRRSSISGNRAGTVGGGIAAVLGVKLNVISTTVKDNQAAIFGGGIVGQGTTTIDSSTISGNTSGGDGGGLEVFGQLLVVNSTIDGNSASARGGGLFSHAFVSDDALVNSTTISDNSASLGGGIFVAGKSAAVKNSIVSDGSSGDCIGPISSEGHNIAHDGSCQLVSLGDLPNTDPTLGPLRNNGGFTRTRALEIGSPAIDSGSSDCPPPATDQRGVVRPQDGNGDGTAMCDIGAFEVSRSR